MPLTFPDFPRVWAALVFLMLLMGENRLNAQEIIRYELRAGYEGNAADPNYILTKQDRLIFSWAVFPDGFPADKTLQGRFSVHLSQDEKIDNQDQLVFDSDVGVVFFQYLTDTLNRPLPSGSHFLIYSFTTGQAGFEKAADPLVRTAVVMDFSTTLEDVSITHFTTSEYDHNTNLDLRVGVEMKCCAKELGNLNGYLKVFISEDSLMSGEHIELATFYPDVEVAEGSNTFRFQQALLSEPDFSRYKYVVVSLEDAYFANAYKNKFSNRYITGLKVVSDVAEANAQRRKDHPYLTYGPFAVNADALEGKDPDLLLKEAAEFYERVSHVISAATKPDATAFLEAADSAFALAGRNEVSTLLYIHPSTVSALYSLYYDIAEQDPVFAAFMDLEQIGFRLGEAMQMGTLMDSAYSRLGRSIFPEDIEITNAVESSGYFKADGADPFANAAIRNPILWREVSAPAVEHYLRIAEFEEADMIINRVRRACDPLLEIAVLAAPLTAQYSRASYLTEALSDDNGLWDFYIAALRFYAAIGDFNSGREVYENLAVLSRAREEIFLTDFRKASAHFFETFHDFNKADSLFQVLDKFYMQRAEMQESALDACYAYNSAALQQRIAPNAKTAAMARDYAAQFSDAKTQSSWFAFDELVNDRATAFKHGLFGIPGYDSYYLSRIRALQAQDQYFAAGDFQKDLAFFLGRDKRYADALAIYEALFPVENIKLTAFRGSFNEEAQLFNTAAHLNVFSRYVNLLLEMPASLPEQVKQDALTTAFQQMLFYHAFILRGNFRMLYNIGESTDPATLRNFEMWKAYKELLNQVYVSDDVNNDDIRKVKAALVETEKELQRASRDSLYFLEGSSPDFDKIRAQLNPGEAAVEMMRIRVNHENYYGAGIRYVAFVVTKEAARPQLIAWDTPGELLESRFYRYYRTAINNKFADTISYAKFFEPLMQHLDGSVKRIYFAPDGVFNLINPATVFNPATGKFLADELQMEHVANIAFVGHNQNIQLTTGAVFGYPRFTIKGAPRASTDPAPRASIGMLASPIAELPGTRTEVEAIGKLLKAKGVDVKTYLGGDVTKKRVYNTRRISVLHFATHGYWLNESPARATPEPYASLSHSALLLSGAQIGDESGYRLRREGVLTAAEIQNLDLFGTELVVLSACETGLGEVIPGEGIYGLKRAFQRAGVRNLVSSLWKVDDTATQKFMLYFYEFLGDAKRIDAAFSRAVARLKAEYPEPYYWGAFTLTRFY